jgi:hypothetical protein
LGRLCVRHADAAQNRAGDFAVADHRTQFHLSDVCNTAQLILSRHNRAARKSKSKTQLVAFDANQGGQRMRQERMPANGHGEPAGYTFFFQIASQSGRRACCVKVDALIMEEAWALFRQKWSVIESMARDSINSRVIDDSVITIVMP